MSPRLRFLNPFKCTHNTIQVLLCSVEQWVSFFLPGVTRDTRMFRNRTSIFKLVRVAVVRVRALAYVVRTSRALFNVERNNEINTLWYFFFFINEKTDLHSVYRTRRCVFRIVIVRASTSPPHTNRVQSMNPPSLFRWPTRCKHRTRSYLQTIIIIFPMLNRANLKRSCKELFYLRDSGIKWYNNM